MRCAVLFMFTFGAVADLFFSIQQFWCFQFQTENDMHLGNKQDQIMRNVSRIHLYLQNLNDVLFAFIFLLLLTAKEYIQ